MKHLVRFTVIFLMLIVISAASADTINFFKTFGGTDYDYGHSVQQTSDGGYALTGSTTSFGAEGLDSFIIKTDSYVVSICHKVLFIWH